MRQGILISAAVFCAVAGLSAPASAEPMTGEQIQKALVGNTTTQTANNQRYWAYFKDADTVYLKSDRGFTDEGVWRVTPDGKYCVKWKTVRQGNEGCWENLRVEGKVLRLEGIGDMTDGSPELLPGNPAGF